MVREWKSFFSLMFQANYDGNKQMVPIRKLFSKIMKASGCYYNKLAENLDGECYFNKSL